MGRNHILGLYLPVCLALAAPLTAAAQDKLLPPDPAKEMARMKALYDSQTRRTGDVHIDAASVTLHLGDRYYFLGPDDAKRVLTEGWDNPPDSATGVLGMIIPKGRTFLDSWGAVITYDLSGYVSDKDADTADYDRLLDQARKGEDDENADRKKGGFPAVHLAGWAQKPTFDKASHSEIWARDIQFAGQPVDTLNYDLRILNRRGVLSLNLVSAMDHLAETRAAAADLARTASFDAGSRYTDYTEGQDRKAAYGVAGLVAAGLGVAAAQKLGGLALIALFLKKGAVLIAAAVAWIAARFRKLLGLGGKPKAAEAAEPPLTLDGPTDPGGQAASKD